MKWFLFAVMMFTGSLSFAQAGPEDVFLEADPSQNAASPVEDLPPNEPPYTKTPDELEAQKLLDQEPPPKEKKIVKPKVETKPMPVLVDDSGKYKIAHPDAKRGLYQIDQNTGRYYYKTSKLSKKNQATSIRMGMIAPPDISSDVGGKTHTFTEIYGEETIPYLILDYEWQPFRSFGKLGVVMGMGFFTASGHGHFANKDVEGGAPAKEGFTFIGLPISAGGIYRLEFSDRQWFAPYVSAGISYYGLAELRDDGKPPKLVGAPAAYGGGGLLVNITAWSKDIEFTMDREYGINNMWFAAEIRVIKGLNKELDISSHVLNFGIAVDY